MGSLEGGTQMLNPPNECSSQRKAAGNSSGFSNLLGFLDLVELSLHFLNRPLEEIGIGLGVELASKDLANRLDC